MTKQCVALVLGDVMKLEITLDEAWKFLEARYVKEGGCVRYDMITNQVLKAQELSAGAAIETPIQQTHFFVTHAIKGISVLIILDQVTYSQRELVGASAVRWSTAKTLFDQFRDMKRALKQEV